MSAEEAVAPARARRPRLLRLPHDETRRDQRRLPAPGRRLRPDRAELSCRSSGAASRSTSALAREGGLESAARSPSRARRAGWRPASTASRGRGEWDAVVTVEAEGVDGDSARFVALTDETLVVEEGGDVEPLAVASSRRRRSAVPRRGDAPERRRSGRSGSAEIEVVELPDDPERRRGDADRRTTASAADGRRRARVRHDPRARALGAGRGRSYVVQAQPDRRARPGRSRRCRSRSR